MTKLPIELYIQILILLPQKSKLECALVCHQWTETALHCLYTQVSIKSQGTLDKFINSINDKPYKRWHVKGISLFEPYQFDFDKRKLCQMLPNLQSVQLFKFNRERPPSKNRFIHSVKATSTITSLDENGTCDFILYLIESNLCDRLERLCLTCSPEYAADRQIPLHLLKNMASLKVLTLGLYGYEFTIWDAETISENIPSIIDFKCVGAKLAKSHLPVRASPNSFAKSVTLHFNGISDAPNAPELYCEWLLYISKKYTGLKKLAINTNEYGSISFEQGRENIFENGWLSLLQSTGRQLEHIENINIPSNNINIFKILDDLKCKVKDVSIHSATGFLDPVTTFAQSQQRNSIQRLVLKNIMVKPNTSLLRDTKLVELKLVFSLCHPVSLSIGNFLRGCPLTLKSLTIENAMINYDGLDDYQCSSVTTISINKDGSVPVNFQMREMVRRCCPNLKCLHLFDPSINFFI
ncbi:hypothetical protein K501DRAFT_311033 [Backusella circina FSU 941]|nr:hypothetical protein K501DRAFT_311033 [Backusella circina FSU 941]